MRHIMCIVVFLLLAPQLWAQRRLMMVSLIVDDALTQHVPNVVAAIASELKHQLSFDAPFFDWNITIVKPNSTAANANIAMKLSLVSPYEQVELAAEVPGTTGSCTGTVLSAQTYRELIKKAKDTFDDELAGNLPPVVWCIVEKLGKSNPIAEKTKGLPTEDYIIASLQFEPAQKYFYYLRMFVTGTTAGQNIPLRRYPRYPDDKLLLKPEDEARDVLRKRDQDLDKLYVDTDQLPQDRVARFWKGSTR